MKIIDALKEVGRPFNIPDCGRDDLPQFFLEMGFKEGVEIGTSEGTYAEIIAKPGLKLHCVDPWKNYDDYYGYPEFQLKLDRQLLKCEKLLAPYDVIIHRKTSMEALQDFADGSLDFVYIDGNHDFKYVAEDIFEWSKKVKKGGVIAGHDYFFSMPRKYDNIHVKYVVDAYTQAFKIKQWYVIGRKDKVEGEVRDNFRSFFWIKS